MTTALIERLTFNEPLEFRSAGEGKIVAHGYGAVFNKLSQNLGGLVERVAPGAFTKTIAEADIRALFNHDPNYLLGRSAAGTLRLSEDGTGLPYEIDLPDTMAGRDVATMLERRDITGSSPTPIPRRPFAVWPKRGRSTSPSCAMQPAAMSSDL
jgi:HK97 family phage prohead protease